MTDTVDMGSAPETVGTLPTPESPTTVYVSYSGLVQHRTCPQKWAFKRVDRLESLVSEDDVPVEREFGSWWHALRAADSAVRGLAKGSLKYVPPEVSLPVNAEGKVSWARVDTPDKVIALLAEWWSHQPLGIRAVWVERLGEDPVTRIQTMNLRWGYVHQMDLQFEEPIAVEVHWERELWVDQSTNTRYVLVGITDEVVRDTKRGIVVARDHKSHKKLGRITKSDELLDSQLQLYVWGLTPTLEQWGIGQVQATAYDRVRMTAPSTPVLTQAGTLSKSVTDYDAITYRAWVGDGQPFAGRKKDGSASGIYTLDEAVLARLDTPAVWAGWCHRTLTPVSRHAMRAHLMSAAVTAADISRTRAQYARDGFASRLFAPHCTWCDYSGLCQAQLTGGPGGDYDLASLRLQKRAES